MPSLAIEMGARDQPLLAQTIGDNLRQTVARVSNNDAIVSLHQDLRWTYQDFYTRVQRLASGLLAAGLKPLDRLGLWSPNYAEWILVHHIQRSQGKRCLMDVCIIVGHLNRVWCMCAIVNLCDCA